jgi:hypothetical protein
MSRPTVPFRLHLDRSDPKKSSPFLSRVRLSCKVPRSQRVRPSKTPRHSPSSGSVTVICRYKTSQTPKTLHTSLSLGPPAPPTTSLATSHVPLHDANLLSGQKSPVHYLLPQCGLTETIDITHDIIPDHVFTHTRTVTIILNTFTPPVIGIILPTYSELPLIH